MSSRSQLRKLRGVCLDYNKKPAKDRVRCFKHLRDEARRQKSAKATRKKWRQDNPDRIRAHRRKWYKNNLEKVRAKDRARYAENPEPKRKSSARWRTNNPDKHLDCVVKKYGLTKGAYAAMFKAQKGLCAICKKPETARANHGGPLRRLAVDHCHKTKRFRELLCARCNGTLGLANDDINLLAAAIRYLRKHWKKAK